MSKNLNFAEAENVAAIAMEWGRDKARFEKVYKAVGEAYGGFPMFYQAAIEAALALERYAVKRKISWGNDADWILTIENYAPAVLEYTIKNHAWPSTVEQFNAIIEATIEG
jgi:hypothetical protein